MATISKSVTVSNGGVYTIELNAIPNGSTVTPVNDIQTWLHCADIWDKNYTTLDQVLADAPTLQALIASNNAADYMARSTDWASDGNVGLVPVMTSNTTPSGVASASSRYSTTYEPWKAFNGTCTDHTDCWHSVENGVANSYLRYQATSPFKCHKVTLQNRRGANNADVYAVNTFKIQGSNDGTTWVDLTDVLTNTNGRTAELTEYVVNSNTAYLYHQILIFTSWDSQGTAVANKYVAIGGLQFYPIAGIPSNQNAMTYIGANEYCANKLLSDSTWRNSICYSTYFESVLNTKVPTMTSNTAPSGEVTASSYYSGSGEGTWYPWGAFRNPPIKAMPSPNSGYTIGGNWGWCSTGSTGAWVRYKFLQPVCINRVDYAGCSWSASWTPKIQGSNDGNNWTDIATLPSPAQNTTNPLTTHFANNNKYLYIRVYNPNGNFQNRNGVQFQFYGRS